MSANNAIEASYQPQAGQLPELLGRTVPANEVRAVTAPAVRLYVEGQFHPDASERRAAERMALDEGRARIEVLQAGLTSLHDISPGGAGLLVATLDGFSVDAQLTATVHLADESPFRTRVRVARFVPTDDGGLHRVGLAFAGLEQPALQALSRFMARENDQHSLDVARLFRDPRLLRSHDPDSIAKLILTHAVHTPNAVRLFQRGRALPVRLQVSALQVPPEAPRLMGRLRGDAAAVQDQEELTCVLPTANSVLIFTATMVQRRQQDVVLSLPEAIVQTGFRDSRRTFLAANDAVHVYYTPPHSPGRRSDHLAIDLAARGLALELDPEQEVLFPGERLADLRLRLPDGSPLLATGVVRSLRQNGSSTSVRCGIELVDFDSDRDRDRWHQLVFSRMHPRVQSAKATDLDGAWRVYEKSTYVQSWIPQDRVEQVRQTFRSGWRQLEQDRGRLLVLNEQDGAVGTIAANQMYPRTWLMHGLAVDKTLRERGGKEHFLGLARELYFGVAYALQHVAHCRYFLSYFEQGKPWNQRLYGNFCRSYGVPADQLLDQAYLYRRRTDRSLSVELKPGLTVGRATASERALIARTAETTLPEQVVDAFSLRENEIDLRSIVRPGRSRTLLVARDGQEPVMAAVCETGGPGLNIFGLMNACWTIPLSRRAPRWETQAALLAELTSHYRRQGIAEFLLIDDKADRAAALAGLDFQSVGPGIRWLASTRVLPAWLAYLESELRP
jgi:c-di-GMP-binding flagellar brake protein YcgR